MKEIWTFHGNKSYRDFSREEVFTILKESACDKNIPTLFFSYESSNALAVSKLLSHMTGIPASKNQDERLTIDEFCKMDKVRKSLEHAPLYVDDVKSLHVSELERTIQSMVKEHGIKIVLIEDIRMVKDFDLSALEDFAKNLDILLIWTHKITKKDC